MTIRLKQAPRSLVFTEGTDPRILEAACRLQSEALIKPILLGNPENIRAAAARDGRSVENMTLLDPASDNSPDFERMVEKMAELRRGKMDAAACREALRHANYYGTMLVKLGRADGLLGGATYSTADTVRPALQLIKTKPGSRLVSSCFILHRLFENSEQIVVMADCALNIQPSPEELADIACQTAQTARSFGVEPTVALLSYSTKGSGKGDSVDRVREAARILAERDTDFSADGELQFDAAFSPAVAALKAPGSPVAGYANTFIFPDIDAGNIGYKMAQRFGGFEALGPILQGLNAPINDLSRGCVAEEVYRMAIITAGLAE